MEDIRIELSVGTVFRIKNGPVLEVVESDGGCTGCYFDNGSDKCGCPDVLVCSYREQIKYVVFVEKKEGSI